MSTLIHPNHTYMSNSKNPVFNKNRNRLCAMVPGVENREQRRNGECKVRRNEVLCNGTQKGGCGTRLGDDVDTETQADGDGWKDPDVWYTCNPST